MKRKILIYTLGLLVICGVIAGAIDMKVSAQPGTEATIVLQDDNLMMVLWLTEDEQYIMQTRGPGTFTVEGNKMYFNGNIYVNNLNKVSYGVYPWQLIEPKYEWDEDLQDFIEAPQYMYELDLQPIGVEDLPKSQHIAKLVGIDAGAAKPAIVARKYLGEVYTINCLVSQSALDMYQASDLAVGDYVIVSFIDEIPDTIEINIAIVTDKVWRSW